MEQKLNGKKPKKMIEKKGPIRLPKEYWTGYKLHKSTATCFYCMGERATINIDGKQYPPIGTDGATVVICNTLHI
ncbi:MAG: hypothetical protein ACFFDY_00580 [Candidatus Thorarchaeota archaeon]